MKKLSKILVFALVAACFLQLPAFAYTPLDTQVSAPRAAVYSIDADRFVYEKNATQECSIASVTKIVTSMVVIEKVGDLKQQVTITQEMIDLIPFDSSTAGLAVGEVYTYEQLLYCLMVPSGNDAAIALAVAVSGSLDAFSGEMNRFVASLGCENTGFVNPHGIDELGQYSTAADLVKILKYCIQNEQFMQFFSTYKYELSIEGYSDTLEHTNKMMDPEGEYYYQYIIGSKTGTDTGAGSCLISLAQKDGLKYITVVLGCERPHEVWGPYTYSDTKALFEDAFSSYAVCTVNKPGEIIGALPVTYMKDGEEVELTVVDSLTAVCDRGMTADNFTHEIDVVGEYIAPLAAGTVVGNVKYYDENGEYVGSSELVTVQGAEYSKFEAIMASLSLVSGWQYLLLLIGAIFVALFIMFIIQSIKRSIRRAKRRKQGKHR